MISNVLNVFFLSRICFQSVPHVSERWHGLTLLQLTRTPLLWIPLYLVQMYLPLLFWSMQIQSRIRIILSPPTALQQSLRYQILYLLYYLLFLMPNLLFVVLHPCEENFYWTSPIHLFTSNTLSITSTTIDIASTITKTFYSVRVLLSLHTCSNNEHLCPNFVEPHPSPLPPN